MSAHLSGRGAAGDRVLGVVKDVTLADIVVFDSLLSTSNGIWSSEQIELLIQVVLVVEIHPRKLLADKLREVRFVACVIAFKSVCKWNAEWS